MAAWKIDRKWDASSFEEYGTHVSKHWKDVSIAKELKATCEDLAIDIVVKFASSSRLPVLFLNGACTRENLLGSPLHRNYGSIADYLKFVKTTTAARDLLNVTVPANAASKDKNGRTDTRSASDLSRAKIGDLLLCYTPVGHVQVVTRPGRSEVGIVQGNFRKADTNFFGCDGAGKLWSNRSDPSSDCYLGVPAASKSYRFDLKKQKWLYYPNTANVGIEHTYLVQRWNWELWNQLESFHSKFDSASIVGLKVI